MPRITKPITLDSFLGLNNVDGPEDMGERYLQVANNVDITDKGKIAKRSGYSLVASGKAHSLFSDGNDIYYVLDGVLTKNFSEELGTGYHDTLQYVKLQDNIYFCGMVSNGIIKRNGTIEEWIPQEDTNHKMIGDWEDAFGNSYGVINHQPLWWSAGPRGHILEIHSGRVYVAVDKTLYFSEPLSPIRWKGVGINFTDRVRAVMPVEDGLWVASDALYYMSGKDPSKFTVNKIEDSIAIEGTAIRVSGDKVPIDNVPAGDGWILTTNQGVLFIKTSGFLTNITEKSVELPFLDRANAGFIDVDGINRYIVNLDNTQSMKAKVSDSITVRVIRNE